MLYINFMFLLCSDISLMISPMRYDSLREDVHTIISSAFDWNLFRIIRPSVSMLWMKTT